MTFSHHARALGSLLSGAALCGVLTSCAVGPDYQRPTLGVPAAYKGATTQPATQPATQPVLSAEWWRLFGDPVLNDLQESAAAANTDLRAAMARVAQARAAARVTAGDFYPTLTFDPSIERARTPANSRGSANNGSTNGGSSRARTQTNVRIPFDLTYEVDIWGRVRRAYESSRAQALAAESDYHVVLQTLQADVAQNYFTLRALDLQGRILAETVESYRRQVELTQKQLKAGLVGNIAAYQADAQLHATIAQQVDVRRQRDVVEHALATLLGRVPGDLSLGENPLDLAPPAIPVGLPSELLRRRPDVAEAEQNLVAANAQVGVATAAFYPRVSLTGLAGFESADLSSALNWEQRVWSIGPSISFPIFEGGRLTASLEQAKARYAELYASYRGSVLTAIRDVEDSLTDLHHRADAAAAQDRAVQSSREYLRLAENQYKQGLITYLIVIDAERTLLSNELSAAQILNQRLVSTVLLIKSLGGGWDPDDAQESAQPK